MWINDSVCCNWQIVADCWGLPNFIESELKEQFVKTSKNTTCMKIWLWLHADVGFVSLEQLSVFHCRSGRSLQRTDSPVMSCRWIAHPCWFQSRWPNHRKWTGPMGKQRCLWRSRKNNLSSRRIQRKKREETQTKQGSVRLLSAFKVLVCEVIVDEPNVCLWYLFKTEITGV